MATAWAAIEALPSSLAVELAPQGIRVICLRSNALPETATIREAYGRFANALGITFEQVEAQNAAMTPLRRLPKLLEVANVAAFMASDQASSITATLANLSCGLLTFLDPTPCFLQTSPVSGAYKPPHNTYLPF